MAQIDPGDSAASASPGESSARRDALALARTDLANERTLLAYIRTALMSAGSGITLIKFFAELSWAVPVGWAFIGLGGVVAAIGASRFVGVRRRVRR